MMGKALTTVVTQKSIHYLIWHNFLYRVKVYPNELPQALVEHSLKHYAYLRSTASSATYAYLK